MSNPVKPAKEILVDLFNAQLAQQNIETEYEVADLTFAAPVAYDPETIDESEPESANTSVVVTAGEGLEQITYQLHFCRLDLARLVAPFDDHVVGAGGENSTHDILALLKTLLGFELTADDVDDVAFTNIDVDSDRCTIRAKATSLAVTGETTIIVLKP